MKPLVPALVLLATLSLALSGCLSGTTEATATLHRVTPHGTGTGSTVYGYANFTQRGDEITVRVEVFNLAEIEGFQPGPKGTHIHTGSSCRPSWDGSSVTPGGQAGGHFNPENASHPEHAGDLGNMEVDEQGHGTLEVTVTGFQLEGNGTRGIEGRAVVIHAGEDDLESQPAGDAGPRLLCGIIERG